ncbi:hypothetical protein QLQ12_35875 [Actinoplanes sp. NEAU-A12]|uniref:Methylamine utilization protein MauE n=1 Tax=Actinoplanes sandaracinus TaxID=3045177 RepID=A0ABT6WW59_9ACTN|nr:hypothetical protein [Actinoplanes sandaracinus]
MLAPVGAVAGVAIGLISVLSSRPQASCFGGECRRDAAHSAFDFDANSGLDGLILINSWLAFFVATVLALLTLVTETVLMVRRHERARGVDSST